MKEYYTHDGREQKGPFTLETLLSAGITGDSLIWHAGLDGWQPARGLEELKFFFVEKVPVPVEQVPLPPVYTPPSPSSGYIPPSTGSDAAGQVPLPPPAYTAPTRPSFGYIPPVTRSGATNTRQRGIILLLVLAGVALVVFFASTRNGEEAVNSGQEGYSGSKPPVADYERTHPAEFLVTAGSYNKTRVDKKMKIYGTVTNKATVTNFKNISIQVSYFSAAKKLISTDLFILTESVPARMTKSFEQTIRPPAGTVSMSWAAKSARPY